MLIDHWAAGDCMHDLRGWYWPGLMGQSLTRKILHYVSERARTDHPYRGLARSVSQDCICCKTLLQQYSVQQDCLLGLLYGLQKPGV